MNNYTQIAKIISIYGKKGYLKVDIVPNFKDALLNAEQVFVDVFGAQRKFIVEEILETGKSFFIKFKNFDSSDEVAFLKGKDISLLLQNVKSSEEKIFLLSELKKFTVYRNGSFFGKVKDILNLDANDVLVLEDADGKEVLIPFVKSIIKKIDDKQKRLELIDGKGDLFDVAY